MRIRDHAVAGVERAAEELRQAEGVQMRLPVPVLESVRVQTLRDQSIDVGGGLLARVLPLPGENEAPGRAETGDEPLVGRHDGEDLAESAMDGGEEEDLVDLRHARLHRHHALYGEPVAD